MATLNPSASFQALRVDNGMTVRPGDFVVIQGSDLFTGSAAELAQALGWVPPAPLPPALALAPAPRVVRPLSEPTLFGATVDEAVDAPMTAQQLIVSATQGRAQQARRAEVYRLVRKHPRQRSSFYADEIFKLHPELSQLDAQHAVLRDLKALEKLSLVAGTNRDGGPATKSARLWWKAVR